MNTLGGWSDNDLFAGKGTPYTVMLGLAGYGGGRVDDFWADDWVDEVHDDAAALAARYAADPWLVGYFLDNEVPWTDDWRKGPFTGFFGRSAAEPGKAHLVTWLRGRYDDDFPAFAADFDTTASDWATLGAATVATAVGAGAQATKDAWSGEVARRFFSVTGEALATSDPDHLNLGVRFIAQLMTPAIVRAAGRHVDVVSINWYEATDETEVGLRGLGPAFLGTSDNLADAARLAGKPLLISEFGWRAKDSGLPNSFPPFQVVVDTQQDRADRYRNFARCLANTGYVVGAHWFEMTDEPAIGRFDGEDDNWGFVKETDEEWAAVTAAAKDVHDALYAPVTDPNWKPGACTPIGPQKAAPTPSTTTTTTTSAPGSSTTVATATTEVPEAGGSTPLPGTPTYTG